METSKPAGPMTSQLNDVFVIGAGASVPYGFPTGASLIQALRRVNTSHNKKDDQQILASLDYPEANLQFQSEHDGLLFWNQSAHGKLCAKWKRLIRGSVILTIDQFLKNLEDDKARELGKRLMARQILKAEENACTEPLDRRGGKPTFSMHSLDWIQEFLTRVDLMKNWQEYLGRTVFLTFNYDRVLEFFLERYLIVDKNWSRTEARRFITEDMSIHHMNGHIGSLEQVPFGNMVGASAEFDPLFDPPLKQAPPIDWTSVSGRMRTVWEDPEHHPDSAQTQAKAKAAIAKAMRIFVMGTSFIPENFEAIGLNSSAAPTIKTWSQCKLSCTVHKLSDAQVQRAVSLLGIPGNLLKDHFFDKTANDLIVDHAVL